MASEGKYFKDNIATLGSVGIGKLTPTEKLDVVGNITLTGDLTIGGTPTAPTASAATNTTQLATTAYVTTAVNNLIDSAPAALDTLNELAAALNDDASFSTTVTNSIATKLPLAGGTMTGAILHSAGSASSPSISWDGDTDTGIYHYGANSFAFTTSGALRGQFQSGGKLKLWGGLELDGNTALIKTTLTVGVDDTGHDVKFYGATSGSYMLWDESEDKLLLNEASLQIIDATPNIQLYDSDTTNQFNIDFNGADVTFKAATTDGDIIFQADNGSGGLATYFHLDGGDHQTKFAKDLKLEDSVVLQIGTGNDLQAYHDGSNSIISNATGDMYFINSADDKDIIFQSDDASGGVATYFYLDGSIGASGYPSTVFPDNAILRFGTGGDLRLFHMSDHSYIQNHTGDLYIQNSADDKDIIFVGDNGSGGTETYFFLDGSASSGNPITIFPDNSHLTLGNDGTGDFYMTHDGSNTHIVNYTGDLKITQNANDKDIVFSCDDGSGGNEAYFYCDGSLSAGYPYTIFPDNSYLALGNSGDLLIYHTGTNSELLSWTGDLYIKQQNNDGNIVIQNDDGSGGLTDYIVVDGSNHRTVAYKDFRFNDNVKANFGTSSDLQIYSDNSNTIIDSFNCGNMLFRQHFADGDMTFQCDDGSGGVETYFYLDGSLSSGSPYTVFPDASYLALGTGADLRIYHDGTNSWLNNATGDLKIRNAANDKDIIFQCDDGNGGETTYFYLDGSAAEYSSGSTDALLTRFPDASKIALGTGADMKLFHNGTNSYIQNETGDLYITQNADDGDIIFQSDDGSGGVATYFKLDGSYTNGIDGETYTVSTVFPDHALLALGTHRDLKIWYNNVRGRIAYTGGNEFQISALNNLMIGFNDSDGVWGETSIYCFKDGKVQIRHDNSTKFETTSTGIAITGGLTTSGASTLSGGLTVGVDDTGYDVKFFGATSGRYVEWDASDDALEFADNTKAKFGTGLDLQIYHDGSNSYISDGGTGNLRIRSNSLRIEAPDSQNIAVFNEDSEVDLYYNGSKKFETTNTGVAITGGITTDGASTLSSTLTVGVDDTGYDVKFFGATSGMYLLWDESANALTGVYDLKLADSREVQLGDGNDLRLYHSHPNSYIKCNQGDLVIQNDADDIKILAEDDVVIRDNDDSTEMAKFINGGAVELYHNGSKKFETTSSGATVTGGLTTTAVSTIGGSLDIEGELNLTGNGNKNFDVFTLANSNTLTIRHHNPSGNLFETAAVFTANAGAELYYDHSKKFETTSAGATVTGNLTVSADLIINGTTTTVNSTTVTIDDPVFTLGGDSAPSTDDNKDRGIEFRYHNGSAAKIGFFGWDDSASVFTFIADASPLSEVYSGSAGNVAFGNIAGTLTTAAQGNITSLGTLTTLTVDDITIDGSTISDAGDLTVDVEGDISFDANGGDFKFQDNGVDIIHLTNVGDSPTFESKISNADIVFKGNDGGSTITALTLDMSAGGNASFSGNTSITGGGTTSPSGVNGLHLMFDSSSATSWIKSEQNGTSNRHLGFHAASYTFNTGASTFNAAITVGVDDTGHDVKFFGATAGSYLMWDESQDRLRLTDSTPMTFGDGDDLRIEHDGSNSYITEQGQNDLYIQPNEASLYVRNAHSGKMMLTAKSGSGHIVELYGNNVKRLATDSSGVNITGELNVGVDDTGHDVKFFGDTAGSFMLWDASQDRLELTDDSRIVFGDGADASIWHGGTDTYIENGTGDLVIRNQADDKDIIFSADAGGTLAEIMRIDGSTGRVGIGVTAPSSPLHTKGAIRIERTANTASSYIDMEGNFRYYADTGYAHAFFSQGSEMVRFYNGQVGIGTTSPEAPLHVLGGYDANDPKTLVLAGREESSSTVYTGIQFERSGGGTFFGLGNDSRSDRDELYVGGGFGSVKTATALRVYTGTRGSSTGTERLTVLSDGNVGIGYASPSHKLHVRAEADGDWVSRITNTEATAGANYGLKIDGGSNASDVALEVSSLAGTHLFEVRGDGNVGIGTTSPSAKVHLNGPSAGFSEILRLQRDGGNYYSIGLDNNDLNFCYNGQSADGSTLVIDGATSRIGIGTKAPSSLLEVRGAAGAAGILTLSTAETTVVDGDELGRINFSAPLESDGTDSILVAASIYAEADDTFDASTNDTDLVFATGASETATEKMRIASDGNVGIGTTSPAQKLHVEGTARITGHTDIANSIDISNTTRIYTKLGVGNSSWVTPTEALEVRGNARIGSSATNGHLIGRKDYSVTESFSTGLTVTLADNTACHVKVFISGDWSGHSSIAYVGEFFIQNAANSGSYNEPGIILTEHDNLASDGILSQIVDGTGDSFTIQFRANTSSSTSVSGRLCYHIMGDATAVS